MLFRILTKSGFKSLVTLFMESNEVVAPKRIGMNASQQPIHQFLPVASFEEIDLSYKTTEFSAKTYFLPYRENLCTYKFEEHDFQQKITYRLYPRVLLGLHACDINALVKLDKVLERDAFPSPYYISRRRNTFIIGFDHEPCEEGFCHAVGSDIVTHGFDLFMTDLGDRYFVAINSDRAFSIVDQVQTREVTEEDTNDYKQVRKHYSQKTRMELDTKNLPNLLDLEFESKVWEKWGKKCLSCGTCAMVCPTCYCYGVSEPISMDFKEGAKVKQLYSCNIRDFAMVAGGHNFRAGAQVRLKYRYYHQHRGFTESYDEPKCVGCNRCGRACLAKITPPDVIRDLQLEAHA